MGFLEPKPKVCVAGRVRLAMRWEIDAPCGEDWDSMDERPQGRHCERCDHAVLDLSRLTRRAALRVLRDQPGPSACVRLRVDPKSGQARFQPQPSHLRGVLGSVALAGALAACEPEPAADILSEPLAEAATLSEAGAVTHSAARSALAPIGGSLLAGVGERTPIAEAMPVSAPAATSRPNVVYSSLPVESSVPTRAQRELTRRKQVAAIPPSHHIMGRMPVRRF